MEVTEAQPRLEWMNTELYRVLSATFPEIRTEQQKVLDVEKLAEEIGMSAEGIYKWFRKGRILSPRGLGKIVELANSPENVAALERAGRTPPTKQDFARLMIP